MADQQKHTDDVGERETKFMSDCAQVIQTLNSNLETVPALLGVICENLDREVIEQKIADQLHRTVTHAVAGLAGIIRGTSLEFLLPPHERSKRA